MKHFILGLLICLTFCKCQLFGQNYPYNQAQAFNEYIKEGSGKWTFNHPEKYNVEDVTFQRIPLNKKDLMGNDLYMYQFKYKNGDEGALVPDNYFYPLSYVLMHKQGKSIASRRIHYMALGSGLICSVTFDEGQPMDNNEKYERIILSHYREAGFVDVNLKVPTYSFTLKSGKGKPFSSWVEFSKSQNYRFRSAGGAYGSYGISGNEYEGLPEFYNSLKKYQESLITEAEKSNLNTQLSAFSDGEYYYFGKKINDVIAPGNVKLKFNKENSKIKSVTVQSSFDDGVFYDKEKFFHTLEPLVNQNSDKISLIPFGDILIVTYLTKENISVSGVFTKNKFDFFAFNLSAKNNFWILGTSKNYYCKTQLESDYDEKKDELMFSNFSKKLFKAINNQLKK